jgi:signal transduction histidine kinase
LLENARLRSAWRESRRELADARTRIVAAGDAVRRKLGCDLHDGAQQRLTGIRIMVQLASERATDQQLAEQLARIGAELDLAVDELRALAHGLCPAALVDRGVPDALRAMAVGASIPIVISDDGVGRCSPAVEKAVYFCALEAIQTAHKHAGRGARVTVHLTRDERCVRFEVADDGIGMELPARGDGIGLTTMRDRIEAVGGELEISAARGRGTSVRGSVPVAGRVGAEHLRAVA